MQLWQMDIVGGVMLVDPVTGELREAKIVTGVDDHTPIASHASKRDPARPANSLPTAFTCLVRRAVRRW
jgi:hypothetical protein